MEEGKVCCRCKGWKPYADFPLQAKAHDGRAPRCKLCHAEANRASRQRVYQTEEGRERRRLYNAFQWTRHREKRNADQRARYAAHRDVWHAAHKRWIAAHADERRTYMNRYLHTYKEHNTERILDIRRVAKARRRSRAVTTGAFTVAEWRALCAQYGNRCLACGAQGPLSPDHVIPLSKGGTNTLDNIQPLCWPCNRRKRARMIDYRPDHQVASTADASAEDGT